MTETALVLFSGGQDSTTCLAWALSNFEQVETVGFAYGQRHAVELACRAPIREGLEAMGGWKGTLGPDHMIDLGATLATIGGTAMTDDVAITMGDEGLPNTFVPGRNLLFLTYAAAIAYRRGLKRIVGGMCETDYSGYPDCRDDTIKAMQVALNLGMQRRFVLEMPLMWIGWVGQGWCRWSWRKPIPVTSAITRRGMTGVMAVIRAQPVNCARMAGVNGDLGCR